jgi:hypothetical protein
VKLHSKNICEKLALLKILFLGEIQGQSNSNGNHIKKKENLESKSDPEILVNLELSQQIISRPP